MRLLAFALLLWGLAAPAFAQYPANQIEWRPRDVALGWVPVWGYDANGDIACPSDDGVNCEYIDDIARARTRGTLSCGEQLRARLGHSGYDTEGHWCRAYALKYGNRDGFVWRAPAHGVNFYWRLDPATGNVECASDGANCYWWAPSLENAFKRTTTVRCQEADYGATLHWCRSLAGERRANGYAWKLHQRLHYDNPTADRIEDRYFSYSPTGDIQCPSNDGRNCFWPKTRAEAEAARQPLACGADHQAKFGITGYDTPGHWCRVIALVEGNAKGLVAQWGLFGLVDGFGIPDVMCAGTDGVNCHWDAPLSVSFKDARPLVCGRDHTSVYGAGGYDDPGHWCAMFATPEVRGLYVRIENQSSSAARVCRPVSLQESDRSPEYAGLRCTDLAAGPTRLATSMAVTTVPIGEERNDGGLHASVCVERSGVAKLFLGPANGGAQVAIDDSIIDGGSKLTELGIIDGTCREVYANFPYR